MSSELLVNRISNMLRVQQWELSEAANFLLRLLNMFTFLVNNVLLLNKMSNHTVTAVSSFFCPTSLLKPTFTVNLNMQVATANVWGFFFFAEKCLQSFLEHHSTDWLQPRCICQSSGFLAFTEPDANKKLQPCAVGCRTVQLQLLVAADKFFRC